MADVIVVNAIENNTVHNMWKKGILTGVINQIFCLLYAIMINFQFSRL